MQTLTQETLKPALYSDTSKVPERIREHPELERVELLATLTNNRFKDALTFCGITMQETGVASAFAIYRDDIGIDISDPIDLGIDETYGPGMDINRSWSERSKVNQCLESQKLLYRWDNVLDCAVPREDVWAFFWTHPMNCMQNGCKKVKALQRPNKNELDFYMQQKKIHSGFVGGIIANNGNKSGMIVFKNNPNTALNPRALGLIGFGDEIDRDISLMTMQNLGLVYADVELSCPKNRDPLKLYEESVGKAVNTLYA
jgi:hypothetical protein